MTEPDDLYLELLDHLENDRQGLAKQVYQRFVALEPSSQRAAVSRARLLELAGENEQALATLEEFVAKNLDAGVARANLARLYYKAGERSKAVSTVRFALMRAPNQERSLHFYAALIQEDGGIEGALDTLKLLAGMPGAWLPAWVAAQLARGHGREEKIAELLVLAARNSPTPFPPNPESFRDLFLAVPTEARRRLASDLRSYCRTEVRAFLDLVLSATVPRYLATDSATKVHAIRRSVWRHLAQPTERSHFGLGPVSLIQPESWGVAEIAGRLGRGYALLVCEALDALAGANGAVLLETDPQRGVVTRTTPLPGTLLAQQAASSCAHLVSSYLSYREPSEFVLDAEIYSEDGIYQGRESFRASHPGDCLSALSQRLAHLGKDRLPETIRPPEPGFALDDALARESVATLTLCAEHALTVETVTNPAQLLDQLADYAAQNPSGGAMLTLWAGVEAAARARLESGLVQRPLIDEILSENPQLRAWVSAV